MRTHDTTSSIESTALRALARALAPLIAEELGLEVSKPPAKDGVSYDEETCRRFVTAAHIGDSVLLRAHTFFSILRDRDRVGSAEVVARLGLKGPTSIPANLTNPLKKRAARLGVGLPWREETDETNRTVWVDVDGNAERIVAGIDNEIASRRLTRAPHTRTKEGQ